MIANETYVATFHKKISPLGFEALLHIKVDRFKRYKKANGLKLRATILGLRALEHIELLKKDEARFVSRCHYIRQGVELNNSTSALMGFRNRL